MAPTLKYYCPCLSPSSIPPLPNLPSSSYSFHEIHNLFFCEECDAVRCNRCVSVEVSGYYCPNCLFEVPSASVRGEKNRCARNCFLCPNCRNTLTVVPSDPPESEDGRIPNSTLGEPPFFLYCSNCRWDSAEVGITFEKPTSLASQLQKFEDSAPDSLEFDRLKEHFEPFLRASSVPSSSSSHAHAASSHHIHTNPITAAASSALARDVPGVVKYNPLARSRIGKDKSSNRDEMPEYRSRMEISTAGGMGSGIGDGDVEFLTHLESISEVGTLEQRWANSWTSSLLSSDLKPLRIPLHSKKSKRCPTCRHILIKPEQKPQTVRYKIKLVAASYMPSVTVSLPRSSTTPLPAKRQAKGSVLSEEEKSSSNSGGMLAGKTYPFHLSFTNPMYDPIQVRLTVQRTHVPSISATSPGESGESSTAATENRRPPFAVSLPTSVFSVAAFAEAWEYDDDEDDDMFDDEHAELDERIRRTTGRISGKSRTVGVLEKKTNMTLIGGEVVIGKEAKGDVKFNIMVTFTYRSDDPSIDDPEMADMSSSRIQTGTATSNKQGTKTFSFYAVVDVGPIIPREETRISVDDF